MTTAPQPAALVWLAALPPHAAATPFVGWKNSSGTATRAVPVTPKTPPARASGFMPPPPRRGDIESGASPGRCPRAPPLQETGDAARATSALPFSRALGLS